MEATIFGWENLRENGDLFSRMLAARKRVFVDQMNWDLPQTLNAESDQYDTCQTIYFVVHKNGEVLAGARILPTIYRFGPVSFMINDAVNGKLSGIPRGILPKQIDPESTVWEATRYFVVPEIGYRDSLTAQKLLLNAMANYAEAQYISGYIALMPTRIYRMFGKFGFLVTTLGPPVEIDGTVHAVGQLPIRLSTKRYALG